MQLRADGYANIQLRIHLTSDTYVPGQSLLSNTTLAREAVPPTKPVGLVTLQRQVNNMSWI